MFFFLEEVIVLVNLMYFLGDWVDNIGMRGVCRGIGGESYQDWEKEMELRFELREFSLGGSFFYFVYELKVRGVLGKENRTQKKRNICYRVVYWS